MRTAADSLAYFQPPAATAAQLTLRGAVERALNPVLLACAHAASCPPGGPAAAGRAVSDRIAAAVQSIYEAVPEGADRTAGVRLLWTARQRALARIQYSYAGQAADWAPVLADLEAAQIQLAGPGNLLDG